MANSLSSEHVQLEFQLPAAPKKDCIGILSLNRPDAANAFHGSMIAGIDACLRQVEATPSCRLLVVQGKGAHFSAGADLAWMKESAQLSPEDNLRETQRMAGMFERLHRLSIPTLAVVKGAAFGGAVGLTACCDFAIAADSSKFCLSEVKLGLMPAVILPYLQRKMPSGQLKRLALGAIPFSGQEALQWGLVEICCPLADINQQVSQVIRALLTAGPRAQQAFKRLLFDLEDFRPKQDQITIQAIATARAGEEAQGGLQAFFAKGSPAWACSLPESWRVEL